MRRLNEYDEEQKLILLQYRKHPTPFKNHEVKTSEPDTPHRGRYLPDFNYTM